MKILLDTNVFLWMSATPDRLNARAKKLCEDRGNTLYLSAVSASEISIKYHLQKLKLPKPPSVLIHYFLVFAC